MYDIISRRLDSLLRSQRLAQSKEHAEQIKQAIQVALNAYCACAQMAGY